MKKEKKKDNERNSQTHFIRDISSLQLKRCFRKGFQFYASHEEELGKCIRTNLEEFPVLQEYADVFGGYQF
jgi:hypothetical protein